MTDWPPNGYELLGGKGELATGPTGQQLFGLCPNCGQRIASAEGAVRMPDPLPLGGGALLQPTATEVLIRLGCGCVVEHYSLRMVEGIIDAEVVTNQLPRPRPELPPADQVP